MQRRSFIGTLLGGLAALPLIRSLTQAAPRPNYSTLMWKPYSKAELSDTGVSHPAGDYTDLRLTRDSSGDLVCSFRHPSRAPEHPTRYDFEIWPDSRRF